MAVDSSELEMPYLRGCRRDGAQRGRESENESERERERERERGYCGGKGEERQLDKNERQLLGLSPIDDLQLLIFYLTQQGWFHLSVDIFNVIKNTPEATSSNVFLMCSQCS